MEVPVTAVILAAGLGTRMKSRRAKVLHEAGGLPLVEHVVRAVRQILPPQRIFVVVGCQADRVKAALERHGVGFVHQEQQRGTAHALLCGRSELEPLGGLLLVLYGDCPLLCADTLRRLIAAQAGSRAAATVLTTFLEDPSGYGRVVRDAEGRLQAIVEQKSARPEELAIREINSGIYCFASELLWPRLEAIRPDNPAAEYYLTDVVALLRRDGYLIETLRADDPTEVLGVNTRLELAEADRILRQRKARELMSEGVTILLPETVRLDCDVLVGADTLIEPFVAILGRSKIGRDCRIGAGSILRDVEAGERVEIRPYTVAEGSLLEDDARVGPFARLRPGTRLGAGAQVGNFVEMKNARLGRGSKANHLAYLGDAAIGENCNIGAGTITCNYDGERKHPTRIGDRVFVGSNATLVAPIELADDCYVGAGSVITDPVPPEALALGRARQVIKDGWVRRRRAAKWEAQQQTSSAEPQSPEGGL
ncbi:MAG: bifunctional UDP-N-acetylglucosamine diphosphorylase/glucosamine-1-phosphate N-acetyltransferase GlmU [Bryobacterales bacterium]|nr:bifunctional UDP-N-acetylglucosamine diphosphorylase/glucosamine-1-phosphate N-acetyltransferase GlmU [Bryobacteraceae bacterium]MDW8128980.1 bifunctional UDP-N-acetylglucosamine diphosphorylase/glucosamine-1-phosphate N-acetyltransferase GlmU [Bryobacterales bacterium]